MTEIIPAEDVKELEILNTSSKASDKKIENKDQELEIGTEIEFSVEKKNDEDQNDESQLDLF